MAPRHGDLSVTLLAYTDCGVQVTPARFSKRRLFGYVSGSDSALPEQAQQRRITAMAIRVGINGFGRIGRQSMKALLERYPNQIEVVAINDITDTFTNAHLFKYDSTYGRFDGTVQVVDNNDLAINGHTIRVFAHRDPAQIPWGEVGAQIV